MDKRFLWVFVLVAAVVVAFIVGSTQGPMLAPKSSGSSPEALSWDVSCPGILSKVAYGQGIRSKSVNMSYCEGFTNPGGPWEPGPYEGPEWDALFTEVKAMALADCQQKLSALAAHEFTCLQNTPCKDCVQEQNLDPCEVTFFDGTAQETFYSNREINPLCWITATAGASGSVTDICTDGICGE